MAIEIVDLPINSMVIFPSVMIQRLPGRVKGKSAGISHGFSHEDHGDMGETIFPWIPMISCYMVHQQQEPPGSSPGS